MKLGLVSKLVLFTLEFLGVAFAHISKDLHHKFSTERKKCVTMIIARPIVYGILKLIKLLRIKMLFLTKILLEILIM
jgi:hypothetical protein